MPSWPSDWIANTLETAGIPSTQQSIAVMRAWKKSTPLPPMTNNPLGMPAKSPGATAYLNTPYGIFPSMSAFYASFAAFAKTAVGKTVANVMNDSGGYPAAWRVISTLNWPASATETDYPAALLDLTSQSYRDSVGAIPATARKTSGTVGGDAEAKASILQMSASINQVLATSNSVREAVRASIVRGIQHG